MDDVLLVDGGGPEASLILPLWCRARCRMLYPCLGVGDADAELIRHIRADFAAARQSEPLLYALRQDLMAACMASWLENHRDGTLIDLGCGLDTLLRRVDNGECRLVYADLPEAMALRTRLLPPRERETYIAMDARGLSPLSGISGDVCIAMGGLLSHFTEKEWRSLLKGLSLLFPGACAAFDGIGRAGMRMARGTGVRSSLPGAAALERLDGVAQARAITRLPAGYRALPFSKRLKLRALLASGVLRFFECRLA